MESSLLFCAGQRNEAVLLLAAGCGSDAAAQAVDNLWCDGWRRAGLAGQQRRNCTDAGQRYANHLCINGGEGVSAIFVMGCQHVPTSLNAFDCGGDDGGGGEGGSGAGSGCGDLVIFIIFVILVSFVIFVILFIVCYFSCRCYYVCYSHCHFSE